MTYTDKTFELLTVANKGRLLPDLDHPKHENAREVGGLWVPLIPIHPTGLLGWKARRACKKAGGHYFHATDGMIGKGCCQCGYRTDGPL